MSCTIELLNEKEIVVEHYEARIVALETMIAELGVTVQRLAMLVDGRNRSAPTKRNMRDEDARDVLVGEAKDLDHKQAASFVGLTYAQVYSCRLGFTFKHVHKELRDSGWRSPWKR
jgi:hypothetical protein